jgi:hypothetical protein
VICKVWKLAIVICSYDLSVVNKSNLSPKAPSVLTHTRDNINGEQGEEGNVGIGDSGNYSTRLVIHSL